MKSKILHLIVVCALFFLIAPLVSGAHAASLSFDPSSINVDAGDTFDIDIVVKIGEDEALGVDALIEYDSSLLEVQDIIDGTLLPIALEEYDETDKIYVVGLSDNSLESVSGEGVLATISFKALSGGTVNMSYICELGETGDSNISENSLDALDIIECSENGDAVIVIGGGTDGGGGGGGSDTTTGGSTGGSELPKTGIVEDMVTIGMIAGAALFLIGIGARVFAA